MSQGITAGSGTRSLPFALALAALCVLAATAWSGSKALAGSTAEPVRGSLSLDVSERVITFGRSIEISGRLRSPDPIAGPVGRRTVLLYIRPYPYENEPRRIDSTTTKPDGTFSFAPRKPDFNARYSVAVDEEEITARSAPVQVFVNAQAETTTQINRDFEVTGRFELRFSPKLPTKLTGKRVHWYFRKTTQKRFTEVDRSRTRSPKRGRLTSKGVFEVPAGQYRFLVLWCIDTPPRDIGFGQPPSKKCPTGTFAARGADLDGRARGTTP